MEIWSERKWAPLKNPLSGGGIIHTQSDTVKRWTGQNGQSTTRIQKDQDFEGEVNQDLYQNVNLAGVEGSPDGTGVSFTALTCLDLGVLCKYNTNLPAEFPILGVEKLPAYLLFKGGPGKESACLSSLCGLP